MKSIDELLADAADGGEIDLDEAIDLMAEELRKNAARVTASQQLLARMDAFDKKVAYIGDLILTIADQINALPSGIEKESATFLRFLDFADIEALYNVVRADAAQASGLTIVQGEVPPFEELT